MTSEKTLSYREPRDQWNPDGWRQIVQAMMERGRELGLARLKGDDEQ